jgi:hypothetical protein
MTLNILHGTGYRVGESDRVIGSSIPNQPDGFIVINQQNGKIFIYSGGVWTDGGTFPNAFFTQDNLDLWILS